MRNKEISFDQVDEALKDASDSTKKTLEELENFTDEHDSVIVKLLESQLKERYPDA